MAAKYGMNPLQIWREFSLRQIVIMYNLAMRATWREHAFQAALHGASMGKEPTWNFGQSASRQRERDREALQAYIASKKAQ